MRLLIRVFPVCDYDKFFVNSSPDKHFVEAMIAHFKTKLLNENSYFISKSDKQFHRKPTKFNRFINFGRQQMGTISFTIILTLSWLFISSFSLQVMKLTARVDDRVDINKQEDRLKPGILFTPC